MIPTGLNLFKELKDSGASIFFCGLHLANSYNKSISTLGTLPLLLVTSIDEIKLKKICNTVGDIRPPKSSEALFLYRENSSELEVKLIGGSVHDFLRDRLLTVQAVAKNVISKELIDPLESFKDITLNNACVNNKTSIETDALNILKVIQYCAESGARMPRKTLAIIKSEKKNLLNIPDPDIGEIIRLFVLSNKAKEIFELMEKLSVLQIVFPKLHQAKKIVQTQKNGISNVQEHSLLALQAVDNSNELVRWAALYHDLGKIVTKKTIDGKIRFFGHEKVSAKWAYKDLVDWGLGREFSKDVSTLCLYHMFDAGPQLTDEAVRRLIRRVGKRLIHNLLTLREADSAGFVGKPTGKWKIKKLRDRVIEQIEKNPFSIAGLKIKRDQVGQITNLTSERDIHLIMELMLDMVLFKRINNVETELIGWLRSINWVNLLSFCPLQLTWFLQQHIARMEGRADENVDGTLKCGTHCKFKCDTQEKDLWMQ